MASATDTELVVITKHVTASAWSVVDAITENPIVGLFDPKAPEIIQQQGNLREAIESVNTASINGREALINALTYLQATVQTTNAFYSDNDAWTRAVIQFTSDIEQLASDIVNKAIKPALTASFKVIWHKFRWYLIGVAIVLVALAVTSKVIGKG